ncbi:putative branched-chain amino acid permease (azaleucine resistance) [Desulfosporosinus orientis DSM 765]|uniref:Putative branched-chain amino acid permease (Azaleucine resistance) n=1 Tax=Desulfosporosinus orientis (strain ATCC 19365 / DSM 765 / NCIMB 8382 / VKM B-1628 / Singapore I) TaxID=768706 RepID=G7WAN2_DESOD|nr:AzlC family ABC transporter permease [Desulfosporosinus orientis]AET66800.1 putative branched-chain amino acid permease (azaleucine resistance) [Desulfosporosinus orientis DSM 765]
MIKEQEISKPKNDKGFLYGLSQSFTIVIGYTPVAITFGILATQFGLTFWEAGLMSFFVYAGASQFIAIEMIHQGATPLMIGITTLIVNIRHLLMSLSVVHFFPERTLPWSMGLSQGLTDETFVLNTRVIKDIEREENRRWVMLGINLGAFSTWVTFSMLGGLIGKWLPVEFSGFQFALLALFIILTASSLSKQNYLTYILAAVMAVVFKLIIPGKIYLIISVALAAGIGAWWRGRKAGNWQGFKNQKGI